MLGPLLQWLDIELLILRKIENEISFVDLGIFNYAIHVIINVFFYKLF